MGYKDRTALLGSVLINDYIKGPGNIHHTQVHKHTKKREKKLVEKERRHKKAKYASMKQRKARKNIVLINLQLIFMNRNWL